MSWRNLRPIVLVLLTIIVPLALLLSLDSKFLTSFDVYRIYSQDSACDLQPPWSSWDALFQVNARSGIMSFGAAKTIDIVWDLAVGQGGRAILIWLSGITFRDALVRVAERDVVPYSLFASISFSDNLQTTIDSALAVWKSSRSHSRMTVLWILLATVYVLSFPTLLSASTSYVTASTRSIKLVDNATVPVEAFGQSASYVYDFRNGSRPWAVNTIFIQGVNITCEGCQYNPHAAHVLPLLSWRVCFLTFWPLFSPRSRSSFPGQMANLSRRPALPLIMFNTNGYTPYDDEPEADTITVNHTTYSVQGASKTCGFYYGGHLYPPRHNTDIGSDDPLAFIDPSQIICEPIQGAYQWGFSFEFLLLVVILQALWSIGQYAVWLDAQLNSALLHQGRHLGRWRAVVDFSELLKDGSGSKDALDSSGEKQLLRLLKRRPYIRYVQGRDDQSLSHSSAASSVRLVSGNAGGTNRSEELLSSGMSRS